MIEICDLVKAYDGFRAVDGLSLRVDPGETENRISDRSEKAKELLIMLREWRREVDAKMPSHNG